LIIFSSLSDAGYRGEVMVAVDNVKAEDFTVKRGDRLVQGFGWLHPQRIHLINRNVIL
jgi:dUTPase